MESFEPSSENRFRADSLLGRINSLLPRIKFPVVVELIPCSVAQGIHFREPRKLLNSQMFLGRIFAGSGQNRENSLLFPCMAGNRTLDDEPARRVPRLDSRFGGNDTRSSNLILNDAPH
jgi:hypothetical protein